MNELNELANIDLDAEIANLKEMVDYMNKLSAVEEIKRLNLEKQVLELEIENLKLDKQMLEWDIEDLKAKNGKTA